jgi:hypothetical protein
MNPSLCRMVLHRKVSRRLIPEPSRLDSGFTVIDHSQVAMAVASFRLAL